MSNRPPLGDDVFDQLLAYARLDVSAERKQQSAAGFGAVLALFDSLEAIEIGETPPSTSFDASWD